MGSAPNNLMAEIIAICKQRRLCFFHATDRKGKHVYTIYRRRPEGDPNPRPVFIDKCRGGERALLNAIKRAAGIAPAPKPRQEETAF